MLTIVTSYSSDSYLTSCSSLASSAFGFLKKYTPRKIRISTIITAMRIISSSRSTRSSFTCRTAEIQLSGPDLGSEQRGRSTDWEDSVHFTSEKIQTVCYLRLKTMLRSTIQLPPSKKRSRAYTPRQTYPLLRLRRRKYLLGDHETTSPLISMSMLGKMESMAYLMDQSPNKSMRKHVDPIRLAILHLSELQAQLFQTSLWSSLYHLLGKQVNVEPESMKSPQQPRSSSSLRIVLFIMILPTFSRLQRLRWALKVVFTEDIPLVNSSCTLPIANWPPLVDKHIENKNSYPVQLLCRSQRSSRRRAFRLGASPKMPLAA